MPRALLAKLTAAQGAAAERRVVTMLFCDIQGSTAMAERLDPEEWTEIVNGAFEQMVNPIFKYEGTVARLMGDGLLAFFGAPVAHEDDPRRAVLAGLAIVEGIRAWRESLPVARDLAVRVGINTGLVVVGAIGSDLRLEYSAIGDAINLAARMEQTATPDTVQISEDTHRIVARLFEVETLGEIQVKGKAKPVPAYRVLRRAASPNRLSQPPHRAALVNRRMEWAAIERAFESMSAGRGGMIFLIGEAGLGKTRLIDEAIERLWPDLEPGSRLYDVSAVSYEATQPYGLLLRLMRLPLGLLPDDPPEKVSARLTEAITENGFQEMDRAVLEILFGLAGASSSPEIGAEQFARRLNSCLERFWRAQAAGPLVIAIDELQWLDASSADCLGELFTLSEIAPILFLCALRRERQSAGWRLMETTGREFPHRLAEVVLHPLNDSESRQMLARLLDETELPDAMTSLILGKAEGNPLFLEEVVRHLMERGVLSRDEGGQWGAIAQAGIILPDTLLALLTARIDRLEDLTRRTLQVAAVIGRQFARSTLAALVDDPESLDSHLLQLQRMELVMETRRLPEPMYSFHHNLVQEAVYNTILLRQRRALHLQVAEVLTAGQEAIPAPIASMVAHHLIEADAPDRALPYLLLAASNALRLNATAEAIAHFQGALPIALKQPDNTSLLVEILNNYGRAFELQSRFAEAKDLYEEFERLALDRGDQSLELNALIALGKLYSNVTPYYDAVYGRALMERARALAEGSGDHVAEVRILWNLVNVDRFDTNSFDVAIANGEKAISLARQLGLTEELAYLLNDMSDVYGMAGRLDLALDQLNEAQQHWQVLGNEPMLADSLSSAGLWDLLVGDLPRAIAKAEQAFAITSRIENMWGEAYSIAVRGISLGWFGNIGQAIDDLRIGREKAGRANFVAGQILTNGYLSWLFQELGEMEEATSHAEESLRISREQLAHFISPSAGRLVSCLLSRGDIDAAIELHADPQTHADHQPLQLMYELNRAAIEIATARGEYSEALLVGQAAVALFKDFQCELWLPDMYYLLGKVHVALGQANDALVQFTEAIRVARQHEMRGVLWRYLAAAAMLEATRDSVLAAQLKTEAAAEIHHIVSTIHGERLQSTFLARPDVMWVMAEDIQLRSTN